ncbi:MAG: NTP/NDP exchange transporter [Parachlamydiales bacterium]|nr:NTP/NDP exchange transporter [Parachlamydiales bacterium]
MRLSQIFPVKRSEWTLFTLMFFIVSLVNINFSILRSMRNALVVADSGGSAAFIPYFELFGTFPASILLTWILSRMMRVFSFRFTFSATLFVFLAFFIAFAFWIYPHKEQIHTLIETKLKFKILFTHWPDLVFYIMAELWKVAILSVIFWGFLNQNLTLNEAKRFYPPLLLGTSVGTMLSGPITVFCTSQFSWNFLPLSEQRWQHSLILLTFCLVICGLLTHLLFSGLSKQFQLRGPKVHKPETFSKRLSLSSSLRYLIESPYLRSLLLIVVAEYICYTLGELIFLETLKAKYPTPAEYCQYMGNLSFWMGVLIAVSAMFITPYLLHKYTWSQTFLMVPILMVAATFAFFSVVCITKYGNFTGAIPIAILLGSFHFCIGRAAKYTLFDAAKELAFIPLNQEGQVKGKLIIDGIGSRLGRGASSFLSILLFALLGGPGESVLFAGILAISFALIMFPASRLVGTELEQSTQQPTV